jgi:hypothetical protein
MSKEYGYIGKEVTQAFRSNKGIFTPQDIIELDQENKWTNFGQLELIETQTISGTPSTLSFDSIQESTYNVHFMTINNYAPQTDNRHLTIQFKVGGVTDTDNDYQYAMSQNNITNGGREHNSANDSRIYLAYNVGVSTGETSNGYLYIYNAGDSTKFTFLTSQFTTFRDTAEIQTNFNSGVYDQTATVNGLQFQTSGGNLEFGSFSLYGIRSF